MQTSRLNAVVPAKPVIFLADNHRVRAFGPPVVAALLTDSSSSPVASGICPSSTWTAGSRRPAP